jgi:hypothetical protein
LSFRLTSRHQIRQLGDGFAGPTRWEPGDSLTKSGGWPGREPPEKSWVPCPRFWKVGPLTLHFLARSTHGRDLPPSSARGIIRHPNRRTPACPRPIRAVLSLNRTCPVLKNICLWAAKSANLTRHRISHLQPTRTKGFWATIDAGPEWLQQLTSHNPVRARERNSDARQKMIHFLGT